MKGFYVLTTYRERKAKAREEAIHWQKDFANHNYSYSELADWTSYFENLAKRYGLTREFRENGII